LMKIMGQNYDYRVKISIFGRGCTLHDMTLSSLSKMVYLTSSEGFLDSNSSMSATDVCYLCLDTVGCMTS